MVAAPLEAGRRGLRMDHQQAEHRAVDRNAGAAERGVETVEERLRVGEVAALAEDPIRNAMLLFLREPGHGVKVPFATPRLTVAQSNATYVVRYRGASGRGRLISYFAAWSASCSSRPKRRRTR